MNYSILNLKTHYSTLRSIIQPSQLVPVLKSLNISTCAITDYNTISGAINFHTKLKEEKIKPILGVEINICANLNVKESESHTITLLAKNRRGWDNIIKLISLSNNPEYWADKPRLDIETLIQHADFANLIGYSGGSGSVLENLINKYGVELATKWASKFADMFVGGFYLYIDFFSPYKELMRQISQTTNIMSFGNPNPHYLKKADQILQKIVLCSEYQTTLQKGHPSPFFSDNRYYILSYEELLEYYTAEELDNTNIIASQIEDFEVSNPPNFPKFDCPNNLSEDEYLRELCRAGWKKKITNKIPKNEEQKYIDRIKYELEVLQGANLSSYFLVLADILNFVRQDGSITGISRGSSGGCLTSYLTDIVNIDPIKYNLLFERFYSVSRKGYPDIDSDIPLGRREATVQYIINKYGKDKVGPILSYQTIKGKGALKAVFRAYDDISFDEQNKITEHLLDESKIVDELQEMDEPSIIMWALENKADKFAEWVRIGEDGKLEGRLAIYFEQAIALERTKSAQSKHAAGIVVAGRPLGDFVPMIYDPSSNSQICGYEMGELEVVGGQKLDLLSLALTDRLMTVREILASGDITIENL